MVMNTHSFKTTLCTSLLLLAGGKSARMGTSKAELLFEGKTFLQHMLDKAHAVGIENC